MHDPRSRTPPSAAVLHLGALGDLVVAIPAIRALRRAMGPRTRVTALVAGAERARCLQSVGCAHEAQDLAGPSWAPLFGEEALPGALAACVVTWDVALVLLRGGDAVARRLEAQGCRRAIHVDPRPPEGVRAPVVDWLVEGVEAATRGPIAAGPCAREGNSRSVRAPRVRVPASWREEARAALEGAGCVPGRTLLVHPGAGGATKRWPLESFLNVGREAPRALGLSPLVVTGPVEADADPDLARGARRAGLPVIEAPPLPRLMALASVAGHFLGNDGGATHVAAAAGARTLALFGPSDARVWAPRGPRVLPPLVAPHGRLDGLPASDVLRALAAR